MRDRDKERNLSDTLHMVIFYLMVAVVVAGVMWLQNKSHGEELPPPRVVAVEYQGVPSWVPEMFEIWTQNSNTVQLVAWGKSYRSVTRAQDQINRSGRYDTGSAPRIGVMTPPRELWQVTGNFRVQDAGTLRDNGTILKDVYISRQKRKGIAMLIVKPINIQTGQIGKGVEVKGEVTLYQRDYTRVNQGWFGRTVQIEKVERSDEGQAWQDACRNFAKYLEKEDKKQKKGGDGK